MTQQPAPPANHMLAKAAASSVILAIISIQAYTAFLRLPCNSVHIPVYCSLPAEPGLYPFLDYGMYSRTKEEGATVSRYLLTATFENGEKAVLTAEDFGLSPYQFKNGLMDAFRAEDFAKIRAYVKDYEVSQNRSVTGLRLENTPLKITREGIVDQPSKLVVELSQALLKGESQ